MVRYNCADSLDRTNAASYFGAVQVDWPLFTHSCHCTLQSLISVPTGGFEYYSVIKAPLAPNQEGCLLPETKAH